MCNDVYGAGNNYEITMGVKVLPGSRAGVDHHGLIWDDYEDNYGFCIDGEQGSDDYYKMTMTVKVPDAAGFGGWADGDTNYDHDKNSMGNNDTNNNDGGSTLAREVRRVCSTLLWLPLTLARGVCRVCSTLLWLPLTLMRGICAFIDRPFITEILVPIFSLNLMMGLFCSWYGWSKEQDRYARTAS